MVQGRNGSVSGKAVSYLGLHIGDYILGPDFVLRRLCFSKKEE